MNETLLRSKSKVMLSLAVVVAGAICLSGSIASAAEMASLQNIQGEVFVQASGSAPDQWTAVQGSAPVNSGDTIKTGSGTCTLQFGEQATFNVKANSLLTVQSSSQSQDIWLKIGKLSAKVDKSKTLKPFQIVTPVAIAAVRGTEVDFDFTEEGGFTIDLHDQGPVQVFNEDADMSLDLEGAKKVTIKFDKETGQLTITNDCSSGAPISINVAGATQVLEACGSMTFTVNLETAAGEQGLPDDTTDTEGDETTPNEGDVEDNVTPSTPEDISPIST